MSGALEGLPLLLQALCSARSIIGDRQEKVLGLLNEFPSTSNVNSLKIFQMQLHFVVVGAFSMYEAFLQDEYGIKDPFVRLEKLIRHSEDRRLASRLENMRLAVNVLKHGRGSSYNSLVERNEDLNFRVRMPDEAFFEEGVVDEVNVLIEVDGSFLDECASTIELTNEFAAAAFGGAAKLVRHGNA